MGHKKVEMKKLQSSHNKGRTADLNSNTTHIKHTHTYTYIYIYRYTYVLILNIAFAWD